MSYRPCTDMPDGTKSLREQIEAYAEEKCQAMREENERLTTALEGVLSTGLNGGNNVRLAYLAAGQKELSTELLERAERSEEAVILARAALNRPAAVNQRTQSLEVCARCGLDLTQLEVYEKCNCAAGPAVGKGGEKG